MENLIRYKPLEITLVIYFLSGVILWTTLFFVSPTYIEFSVSKEQARKIQIPKDRKVFVTELTIENHKDYFQKKSEIQDTHANVAGALFVYGLAGFLIIFTFAEKIVHKYYLPIILLLYTLIHIVANIYYNFIFKPFTTLSDSYTEYFILIKPLPIVLISYLFFRALFLTLGSEEPKFVGKMGFFTDPLNWLFTTCVMFSGLLVGNLMFWF